MPFFQPIKRLWPFKYPAGGLGGSNQIQNPMDIYEATGTLSTADLTAGGIKTLIPSIANYTIIPLQYTIQNKYNGTVTNDFINVQFGRYDLNAGGSFSGLSSSINTYTNATTEYIRTCSAGSTSTLVSDNSNGNTLSTSILINISPEGPITSGNATVAWSIIYYKFLIQ